MATFEHWSVVVVPFPFTDIRPAKRRPALVISNERYGQSPETAEAGPVAVYLLVGFAYFLVRAQFEALWFMPAVSLFALLLLGIALARR